MDSYDVYIDNPARTDPPLGDLPFDPAQLKRRGLIHLDLPLLDVRAIIAIARRSGANAYVIPVKYRSPVISIDSARNIAFKRYAELRASGRTLAPLDEGVDDLLWWTFCADDLKALEEERIPGRICISVDKVDGHLQTPEDLEAWLRWSDC